jgi:hypothetical protein
MRNIQKQELAQRGIPVIYEHRLNRVEKMDGRIVSITLDYAPPDRLGIPLEQPKTPSAKIFSANIFIDCSYEGDLMAKAGVSYTIGREATTQYGESLAGTRPMLVTYKIDPYVKPGQPKSGLLPLLQDLELKPPGSADRLTMAYCFRWKLSRAEDRIQIEKPNNYDSRLYEIFRRGFQSKVNMQLGFKMHELGKLVDDPGKGVFRENSSRALWAQSIAGCNANYPDGDWADRSRIWNFHMDFIRGMYHFLRNDPTVPDNLRAQAEATGLHPGIFDETGGWPHQLYVREARRMQAAYIVTQKDLEGATAPEDSLGLGSYGVDDWPYATVPHEGGIAINGGEFSLLNPNPNHDGVFRIPYRAITPLESECSNLLVPVCCSASHIAMTAIRMEPVWIILGQSAGAAAAMASKDGVAVQNLNYKQLRIALLNLGQKLENI